MADTPPYGKPGFDINGDQRGRIIGSLTSILVITITCVALRLISRKLSRAGFWVGLAPCNHAITHFQSGS